MTRSAEIGQSPHVPGPVHPGLVEYAARAHRDALRSTLANGEMANTSRDAVAALLATTEAALHRGGALTAADAPFSATLVADMPPAERYVLLNQCTPGLGRDDAPVIVVGTEAAFPRPCCCSTADRRGTRVGGNWHVCFWTRAGQPTWSWRKRPSDDHSLRPQGVATDWSCSHAP